MINEGIMNHIDIKKPDLKYYSAEAYKSLRSNLQFCGGDKKTIVFTSCTQNEGKTRIVLNLAISLAEIGKRYCCLMRISENLYCSDK